MTLTIKSISQVARVKPGSYVWRDGDKNIILIPSQMKS